jgi:hypothetical protein
MPAQERRPARSRIVIVVLAVCALVVLSALGYLALALHYESLKPNPKTDRLAAMLAELPPCPPAESAWYAYMDAMHPRHLGEDETSETNMTRTEFVIDKALRTRLEDSWCPVHDGIFWSVYHTAEAAQTSREAVASGAAGELMTIMLERFAPTRAALVEASKVPVFGVRAPTRSDTRSVAFLGDGFISFYPEFPEAEIGLAETRWLRNIAGVLEFDATHALSNGDAERALVDIETIARMARHADEVRSQIGQLQSLALRAKVWGLIGAGVSRQPALWSDAQLARLEAALASLDARGHELDLAWEEAYFEAVASRYYSDDGAGDGVLRFKAVLTPMRDESLKQPSPYWGTAVTLMTPWYVWRAPSRAELTRDFEGHLDSMRARMAMPLWKRQRPTSERFIEELTSQPLRSVSDPVGVLVFSRLDRAIDTFAWTAHRDGARLALVIERFRRKLGRMPETLEELLAFAREQKLEGPPAPWGLAPLTTDTQSGKPYRLEIVAAEDGSPSQRVEIWSDGPQDPELADELWTTEKGFRVVPPHPRSWEQE